MSVMNDQKIYAGIVTYNPDLTRLNEIISAVYPQADKLIIVDNGSVNYAEICELIKQFPNVCMIHNHKNQGIAKALNQIMETAKAENANWVLSLDQDSVISDSLIAHYRPYLDTPGLGMLTCILKDRNTTGFTAKNLNGECEEVQRCITSGCLTSVEAWENVGRYDEKMFIDYVDYDLCMSLREHGYKIMRVNTEGILHELGHSKDVRFNGKDTVVFNHSPMRKYHIVRNRLYYTRKHASIVNTRLEYKGILKYVLTALIYEDNKISNLGAMIRGAVDSLKMR